MLNEIAQLLRKLEELTKDTSFTITIVENTPNYDENQFNCLRQVEGQLKSSIKRLHTAITWYRKYEEAKSAK